MPIVGTILSAYPKKAAIKFLVPRDLERSKRNMDNLEIYQSELGEKAAKLILEHLYDLTLRKIPKVKGKETPDYEILNSAGNIVAVAEVKTCVDTIRPHENDPSLTSEELARISKGRDRNHRSKLRKHHGKALSQLKGFGDLTTIVIFISLDMTDHIDMDMVLQEHQDLYPETVLADLYLLAKIHQGIIGSNTFDITQTAQLRSSNEKGNEFGKKNMSLSESLRKGGVLPISFSL